MVVQSLVRLRLLVLPECSQLHSRPLLASQVMHHDFFVNPLSGMT